MARIAVSAYKIFSVKFYLKLAKSLLPWPKTDFMTKENKWRKKKKERKRKKFLKIRRDILMIFYLGL